MGDVKKVLVEAIVVSEGEYAGKPLVRVEVEGGSMLIDVDPSLVRPFVPAELDVDEAFGGMPPGTVEVTRERWLELQNQDEARTVTVRTVESEAGGKIGGMSTRYFEVTSRG